MHELHRVIRLFIYCTVVCVLWAGTAAARVISESLSEYVSSGDGGEAARVWVYLADHGETSEQGLREQLARVRIGERALERREMRAHFSGPDLHDLPVHGAYVDAVRSLGCGVLHSSKYFNAISAYASAEQLRGLADLPFVRRIERVREATRPAPRRLSMDAWVLPKVDGPAAAPSDIDYGFSDFQQRQIDVPRLHAEGYHGEGVRIAVLDTGFFLDHVGFSSLNLIAQYDFIQNDSVTADQPGEVQGQMGHGTASLGLVASNWPGSVMGTAWGAEFVLAKTERLLEELHIEEDDYVAALEWADELGCDVVSSSLGYYTWYRFDDMDGNSTLTTRAADIAASRGILVVTAVGNEGGFPWPTINAPADADSVVAVGACDSSGTVTEFSSRGPTYDGRIKPDVLGPGKFTATLSWQSVNGPAPAAGTSASAPLVAGACALILQKHPDWSPMQVREALRATASHSADPDNNHGWGVVDAYAAANHSTAIRVSVDVRPGSCDDPFNPKSRGVLPAAVLGAADVDARDIDVASLALAGAHALRASVGDFGGAGDCSGSDGVDDLLVKFDSEEIAAGIGPVVKGASVTLALTGQLADGTPIEGEAVVRIVGAQGIDAASDASQQSTSSTFALHQNVPNPFNPRTTIAFDVPDGGGAVRLTVYDVSGRRVATLVDGRQEAGAHTVDWNGRDANGRAVASGVYFYRLETPGGTLTRKMVLIE